MTTTIAPETTAPNGAVSTSTPAPALTTPLTNDALKQRIEELRSRVKETGSLMPVKAAETVEAATDVVADPAAVVDAPIDTAARPRNPDGTFAKLNADADPDLPATADVATDGEIEETPALRVSLPPRNEGEPETEIEVNDPAIAERLRELRNNGMRRAEYNKQVSALAQQRAEMQEFAAIVETAPEVLIDRMTPERRERLFSYMLAMDFETHRPKIEQWYQDDVARREALLGMRDQVGKYRSEATQRSTAERRADEIRGAVRALVPETADEQDAQDFYTDALAHLTNVAHERGDIDPRAVAELLGSRHRRYFGANAPAAAAASASAAIAVARPVGPSAEELAKRARTAQARTQAAQATRVVAAKVAPQGAGAVPTVVDPRPPKGMDLKGTIEWARKNMQKWAKT